MSKGNSTRERAGNENAPERNRSHASPFDGDSRADPEDALLEELRCQEIPAVWKTLQALPAALGTTGMPVADMRRTFDASLEVVITRLTELDATPPPHLTSSLIARRLNSATDFASLKREFAALFDRLRLAMVRAHVAEIYGDEELMGRLGAIAARRLKGTGRAPLGAVHESIIEILADERWNRGEKDVGGLTEREREPT